ncbi:MAG: hypothetical protein PHH01_02995 [Patescibacteria group bacterium]|nr:hypothetical protein [Patescibacteria group bacterium]
MSQEEQLTPIQKLIRAYQQPNFDFATSPGEPSIQVSRMASRMAFVYERVRNALEYQEVHLIRKNAIERIMKRRLITRIKPSALAQDLLYELIRGRYLPNGQVPEHKISEVAAILNKYFYLFNRLPLYLSGKEKRKTYKWLLGIAAVEIDHCLVSPHQIQALVDFMYNTIQQNVLLDKKIPELDRKIQIYLAVQRALLRSDQPILRYHLFRYYNQGWFTADRELVDNVAKNIRAIKDQVEHQVSHPIGDSLFRYLKKYTIYFHVIKDVVAEDPMTAEQRLKDQTALEASSIEACTKRYKLARDKLRRGAIRAIIYIFLTKMMLALILEVPYDLYLYSKLNLYGLGVNVIFHPFLLFLIALTVRIPAKENTEQVFKGIVSILTNGDAREVLIRRVFKRRKILTSIFSFIYSITFIVSFSALIYILNRFNFNPLSIALFILFLTLVSFFGIRTREEAKEYIVVARKESLFGFLIDLFSMPIVRAGRWLSIKAPKINVIIFVFDFIIEAPYKTIVNIFDELTKFIREKKEEL